MVSTQRGIRLLHTLLYAIVFCLPSITLYGISDYSRSDAFPVFSTLDPQSFVYTRFRQHLLHPDLDESDTIRDRAQLSITPFGQNADEGKDVCQNRVEIGDILGRWDTLTLLYGSLPEGKTWPSSLSTARETLFGITDPTEVINYSQAIDPKQLMGFFSVPLQYRKRGVRFQFQMNLGNDIGIRVESGLANISQNVCTSQICPCASLVVPSVDPLITGVQCGAVCQTFINETNNQGDTPFSSTDYPNITVNNVNNTLMDPFYCTIAPQIGLDLSNFNRFSAEDVRTGLYWRHGFLINGERDEWPVFLFMPFAMLEGSFSVSKVPSARQAFGLSTSNNGHNAVGLTVGMDGEFATSIGLGMEFGYTHYFKRDVCNMFIPTSCYQQAIYPFSTDACVQPGDNWLFGAKLTAYHFIERLSFFFEYILVQHEKDSIKLHHADPAFLPRILENRSSFRTQVANIAFNYDISPNIGLGILWQAPLKQQCAFRSTTLMIGFNATF